MSKTTNLSALSDVVTANTDGTVTYTNDGEAALTVQSTGANSWLVMDNTSAAYIHNTANTPLVMTTNGTERMRIDASGRVTMPYQPAFLAKAATDVTPSAYVKIAFTDQDLNIGNHYDAVNSRFTAPVDGTYVFSANIRIGLSGKLRVWTGDIRKNGTSVYSRFIGQGGGNDYDGSTGYDHPYASGMCILYLNAGDYVEIYNGAELGWTGTAQIQATGGSTQFSGYLLG